MAHSNSYQGSFRYSQRYDPARQPMHSLGRRVIDKRRWWPVRCRSAPICLRPLVSNSDGGLAAKVMVTPRPRRVVKRWYLRVTIGVGLSELLERDYANASGV